MEKQVVDQIVNGQLTPTEWCREYVVYVVQNSLILLPTRRHSTSLYKGVMIGMTPNYCFKSLRDVSYISLALLLHCTKLMLMVFVVKNTTSMCVSKSK